MTTRAVIVLIVFILVSGLLVYLSLSNDDPKR